MTQTLFPLIAVNEVCERLLANSYNVYSDKVYTFFTDNKVLIIRTLRVKEASKSKASLDIIEALMSFHYEPVRPGKWFDLKSIYVRPVKIKCGHCRGIGNLDRCPECDGTGDVEFENNYNTYTVGCSTCNGESYIYDKDDKENRYTCCACEGKGDTGYGDEGRTKIHKVYDTYLKADYIDVLINLPEIEVFLPHDKDKNYCFFKFNGGEAILMVMDKP